MEMRQRLIQEKLPSEDWIDIKQSRGGIVDCEFLVQYLILIHGAGHPRIVRRNLDNALWAFQKEGLLPADQADILLENYRFYRLVENRLRLLLDRSENRIGPDDTIRRHLARLLALPEDTDLINELRQRFERVYSIYHMYLEA